MNIVVRNESREERLKVAVADNYDFSSGLQEGQFNEKDDLSQIRYFHTDGLFIWDTTATLQDCICLSYKQDKPFVLLIFHAEGDFSVEDGEEQVNVMPDTHNIESVGEQHINLHYPAGPSVNSFVVMLSKAFCLRMLPQETEAYGHLLRAIEHGNRAQLSSIYLPLNQDMRRVIDNIRNCSRKGSFHRLCLEIKIAELLMLQLEQYKLLQFEQKGKSSFHRLDIDKIEAAKSILEENYQTPPTIRTLSMMVGMNESKLKTSFKKTFHITIHDYIVKLRMQKAVALLDEQDLLVRQVALEVGYQKPSHFSAAFKKYYGYGPTEIVHI